MSDTIDKEIDKLIQDLGRGMMNRTYFYDGVSRRRLITFSFLGFSIEIFGRKQKRPDYKDFL